MMGKRTWRGLLAVSTFALLAGCGWFGGGYACRQGSPRRRSPDRANWDVAFGQCRGGSPTRCQLRLMRPVGHTDGRSVVGAKGGQRAQKEAADKAAAEHDAKAREQRDAADREAKAKQKSPSTGQFAACRRCPHLRSSRRHAQILELRHRHDLLELDVELLDQRRRSRPCRRHLPSEVGRRLVLRDLRHAQQLLLQIGLSRRLARPPRKCGGALPAAVPLGASRPNQLRSRKPLRSSPASRAVGTSSRSGRRTAPSCSTIRTLPALCVGHEGRVEHHLDAAVEDVAGGVDDGLVGRVLHLDAGGAGQHLAGEMGDRAQPRRAVPVLAGILSWRAPRTPASCWRRAAW